MRKSIFLLFLFNLFITGNAQVITDTIPDQINFNNAAAEEASYVSLTFFEKVYLHTDRTYYYSGDDIWFKAYVVEAEDRLLSDLSNNLHVELISPSSKIISSRIIRIDSGLGKGDFKLPADLRSGRYKLRAYTNYMRNFSDQLFFRKEIIVINSTDEKDEIAYEAKYVENNIHLSFFPEGGSLVENVSSLVAFKAVNNPGKGCDVSGKIYSSKGDLITTFRSTHLGMGSFFLRPLPGLSYYSIFRGPDSIDVRSELPGSFPDGVTFSASINEYNELLITTRTNPQYFQPDSEHDLLLKFSLRSEIIKTVQCIIRAPTTSFLVPTYDLPDGIVMLTLSTPDDIPLSERLVYIQKEAPVKIQIETDKLIYEKREPVSLNISMQGDLMNDVTANVSLAVVRKNLTDNTSRFPGNISSWFLLESDVHGLVEEPSWYFDPSNTNRLRDLDLLLLTQGWRDFAWKYDTDYFPPENGFTISGRLRKYYTKKSIEDSRVSIGIFGNDNTFFTTVPVDSTGAFSLSGIDFTGESRLIVTGIGKKDRMKGLLLLDSLTYTPAPLSEPPTPVLIVAENDRSELKTYYEINEAIRKKYKLSDTIGLGEVRIIAERHKDPQTVKIESSRRKYDRPDSEVIITQQMQSYPYLIEILRGHVPGVVVTGSYPDYKVIIRGLSSINASGYPLVLIDGNQASFYDLISMPIPAIDRIDVLKSYATTNIFGMKGANGVINLITRTGGWADVPVTYSANIKISGYNAPRIFYSPKHLPDTDSSFEPDLRSTLLWEPDINLNSINKAVLNYYNGDNTSTMDITLEGITTTGIPVTGKAAYKVK